jgi:aryl-alcohol dehydrogenase-like predicted oxidoreductase
MEWSLVERGIEASVVPVARELGIGIVAYSPLARGLLGAAPLSHEQLKATNDRRLNLPRFAADTLGSNAAKAAALSAIAARAGCTAAQLSLAWLLRQGADVFPIPGTKTIARVEENWGALAVAERLTAAELAEVEALRLSEQIEGARYGEGGMKYAFESRA